MNEKEFEKIEQKHAAIIKKSKYYIEQIKDSEHNMSHTEDVVYFTKKLLQTIPIKIDAEVCIIAAYWHDVGRMKKQNGHEKISGKMLKKEMQNLSYSESMINKCVFAIENHGWNQKPKTNEGLLIKDADKLGWIGIRRWNECLKNYYHLDSIVQKLPKLRNNILYFEESKKIYDQEIVRLLTFLYNNIFINH